MAELGVRVEWIGTTKGESGPSRFGLLLLDGAALMVWRDRHASYLRFMPPCCLTQFRPITGTAGNPPPTYYLCSCKETRVDRSGYHYLEVASETNPQWSSTLSSWLAYYDVSPLREELLVAELVEASRNWALPREDKNISGVEMLEQAQVLAQELRSLSGSKV